MRNKRGALGIMWDTLVPYLIAFGVLVLVLLAYFALVDKGEGGLSFLRDIIRFR